MGQGLATLVQVPGLLRKLIVQVARPRAAPSRWVAGTRIRQVEVADTVGCGDSFASAIVMGYLSRGEWAALALAAAAGPPQRDRRWRGCLSPGPGSSSSSWVEGSGLRDVGRAAFPAGGSRPEGGGSANNASAADQLLLATATLTLANAVGAATATRTGAGRNVATRDKAGVS
jgi:hypothetical protein